MHSTTGVPAPFQKVAIRATAGSAIILVGKRRIRLLKGVLITCNPGFSAGRVKEGSTSDGGGGWLSKLLHIGLNSV